MRTFTKSSGTALPGLLLEKYFPKTLHKFLNQFDQVVLITGTNGKTTTSRMLCHLLEKNGYKFISNSSGSNLIRGIASVLIDKSNYIGKVEVKIAVFEVEEATMPRLTKVIKPSTIIVTNIFRDQLDAYGEIDKTYRHIKNSIQNSDNPHLILNLDDHRVRSLEDFSTNKIDFIAFNEKYLKFIKFENKEKKEGRKEQKEEIYEINSIEYNGNETKFKINDVMSFEIRIPGMHNTYNAVAAELGFAYLIKQNLFDIDRKKYDLDLSDFEAAFGRGEIIKVKSHKLKVKNAETEFQILLVKNPAGMNLNLQLVKDLNEDEAILFILNDKIADGRDVSWIWDCEFDLIKSVDPKNIFVAGSRRYDMAIRVSYELRIANYDFEDNIFETIEESIKELAEKGFKKVYVLPTYTAMREFREEIAKLVEVKKMYE